MLVNFVGAPGAGKTTMMAGVFYHLKSDGWDVESIAEASKDKIYENDTFSLSDELLIFAEKYRRVLRLAGTDIKLTDTSLRQSAFYAEGQFGPTGETFFREVAENFDNIYIIVRRTAPYVTKGRIQDETEAASIGQHIVDDIHQSGCPIISINGSHDMLQAAADFVSEEARKRGLAPKFQG